jgi:hypothetical protein
MKIKEKILNHGAGCFDELVEAFTTEEIDAMNTELIREDYKSEFDFKYGVAFAYVRDWLIENIDNGNAGSEVQALFEIYCAM